MNFYVESITMTLKLIDDGTLYIDNNKIKYVSGQITISVSGHENGITTDTSVYEKINLPYPIKYISSDKNPSEDKKITQEKELVLITNEMTVSFKDKIVKCTVKNPLESKPDKFNVYVTFVDTILDGTTTVTGDLTIDKQSSGTVVVNELAGGDVKVERATGGYIHLNNVGNDNEMWFHNFHNNLMWVATVEGNESGYYKTIDIAEAKLSDNRTYFFVIRGQDSPSSEGTYPWCQGFLNLSLKTREVVIENLSSYDAIPVMIMNNYHYLPEALSNFEGRSSKTLIVYFIYYIKTKTEMLISTYMNFETTFYIDFYETPLYLDSDFDFKWQ